MKTRFPFLKYVDREAFIWIAGLLFLALTHFDNSHFTICPFNLLGLGHCPGCGLGLSLHYLFNLSFKESFKAHPLGPVAFLIITHRIYSLQISTIRELIKNSN
jgi:hypothetical protein